MSVTTQKITLAAAEEIRSFLRSLGQIAGALQAAARCAHEIERLSRLSDAQLAARGQRRDEIARHVFETHCPE